MIKDIQLQYEMHRLAINDTSMIDKYKNKINPYIGKEVICIKNFTHFKYGEFKRDNFYKIVSFSCLDDLEKINILFNGYEIFISFYEFFLYFELKTKNDIRKEKIEKLLNGYDGYDV